jgi:molybdopterin converting factor small subunit
VSVTVTIPASLRKKWPNAKEQVFCEGQTIGECITHLDGQFPGFKENLLDGKGNIKETITMFLDGQNVRNLNGLLTAVHDDDEISIIPFVAGG